MLVDSKIKYLLGLYSSQPIKKLLNYQIDVGGKRLRPTLAILSCLALGGKKKDALYPAAGLEIIHNYTLIIDDIIDNSSIRRGKPTVWKKLGASIAQCLAVDYGAAIFQAANFSKYHQKFSELFAKTIKKLVEGEILDILFEQSGREQEPYVQKNRFRKITEKDYFKMAGQKTAFLIAASCEAGAFAANGSKEKVAALKKFGFNLGVAFQIKDDLLDIASGNDIKERKLGNIAILLSKQKRVFNILKKKVITNKDVKEAKNLIRKTDAEKKSLKLAEGYIQKAKKSLVSLPQNKWTKALLQIADFAIQRKL